MLPISIKDGSFDYGPVKIPYSSVLGAGIGERDQDHGEKHRTLLIKYVMPGEQKPRLINFGLKAGQPGTELVTAFRARVAPNLWLGEKGFFAMRKALGFSSRRVFGFIAAVVVATVIGLVILGAQHRAPSQSGAWKVPATAGGARAGHH